MVVHRTARFGQIPARTVDGLRVTAPEQTLLDAAATIADPDELAWMIEQLRARRLVTVESIERSVLRSGTVGRAGAAQLRAVVASLDPVAAESALEVKVARVLRRSGLPMPERQVPVVVGGEQYRLDFAWTWRRVALECDGRRFHSDPEVFRRDRERWSGIAATLGYRMLFATRFDATEQPASIVTRVADALAA
ncbi:MAG TPA: hypothetical protein VFZ83_06055 [Acidimicrobiia bacterium]|nr:hypothetical protein [Acidimicrobiia bacterium]